MGERDEALIITGIIRSMYYFEALRCNACGSKKGYTTMYTCGGLRETHVLTLSLI